MYSSSPDDRGRLPVFCSQSKQLPPLIEILTFITIIESRINNADFVPAEGGRRGRERERRDEMESDQEYQGLFPSVTSIS